MTDLKFSPTGKFAGTVGEDRKVIVWDLAKLPPTQAHNLSPELVSPGPATQRPRARAPGAAGSPRTPPPLSARGAKQDHGAAIAFSPDDAYFAVVFARSKEVKVRAAPPRAPGRGAARG